MSVEHVTKRILNIRSVVVVAMGIITLTTIKAAPSDDINFRF